MSSGIREFVVGEDTYKYVELTPIEALRFGPRVAKVLGPILHPLISSLDKEGNVQVKHIMASIGSELEKIDEEEMLKLIMGALTHVFTPQNESLGNEAVFNSWFSVKKSDLFIVGFMAVFKLAQDFFPKVPDTIMTDFRK